MSQSMHVTGIGKAAIPLPSDRSVGFVFTGVALVVAWLWRADPFVMTLALATANILACVSLSFPRWLRPLNLVWFRFGMVLHKVMNPVIMLVPYAVAIVPAGLLMQRMRDPLRLTRSSGSTYWITPDKPASPPSMTNQF